MTWSEIVYNCLSNNWKFATEQLKQYGKQTQTAFLTNEKKKMKQVSFGRWTKLELKIEKLWNFDHILLPILSFIEGNTTLISTFYFYGPNNLMYIKLYIEKLCCTFDIGCNYYPHCWASLLLIVGFSLRRQYFLHIVWHFPFSLLKSHVIDHNNL